MLATNFFFIFWCSFNVYSATELVSVFMNGMIIGSNIIMAVHNSEIISFERTMRQFRNQLLKEFFTDTLEILVPTLSEEQIKILKERMEAKRNALENQDN